MTNSENPAAVRAMPERHDDLIPVLRARAEAIAIHNHPTAGVDWPCLNQQALIGQSIGAILDHIDALEAIIQSGPDHAPFPCQHCGRPVLSYKRRTRRYCSRSCVSMACVQRKKDREADMEAKLRAASDPLHRAAIMDGILEAGSHE